MNTTLVLQSRLDLVSETVGQLLAICNLSSSTYEKLELCLIEALNNAVIHGNASNPNKRILICISDQQGEMQVRITDELRGVDQDALDIASLPNPAAVSGRGLVLIKSLLPESRVEQGDIVLVIK
jgi:serine/threonine-protein kinase RsbW